MNKMKHRNIMKKQQMKRHLLVYAVSTLAVLFVTQCESAPAKEEPVVAVREGADQVNEQLKKLTVYNFPLNQSKLSQAAYRQWKDENLVALKAIAAGMEEGLKLEITGHTDNIGGEKYNQDLGRRRAQYIADQLANDGMSRNRMVTRSAGYSSPLPGEAGNSAKNRRVTFRVVAK